MSQYRRVFAVLVFAAVCPLASFSQNNATFHVQGQQIDSNSGSPFQVYAVDLNNDGVQDIVETRNRIPNEFFVYLANGDGSFTKKFTYTFAETYQSNTPIAVGDFNGDGFADLVFIMDNTRQLVVFLGNGDGTFRAPRYEDAVVPSGQDLGSETVAAADFNGDGKLDFVAEVYGTAGSMLDVFPGNGDGTFGTPITVYTPPANQGLGLDIATGDFDADGRADIAFEDVSNCNQGGECNTALHVLYGDGGFSFTDAMVYTSPYDFSFLAGDVNSDGRSDLVAVVGLTSEQLAVMYGQTDRTFALYTQAAGSSTTNYIYQISGFALGDFNGDQRMDIVTLSYDQSDVWYFDIFLGTSSPGTFTQQRVALPPYAQWTTPVVADFNRDLKPDILTVGQDQRSSANPQPMHIVQARDTTASGFWGGCAYPAKGQGIDKCLPTTTAQASPVHFNAAANSYGNLRKIELWVDGSKVAEQWHAWEQRAWFDKSMTFAPGSHSGTFIAGDVDNHLQRLMFTFDVVNCSEPSSAGVHVCSPMNGSTVSSPVKAVAAARVTGTIQRMELWVDGVKKDTVYNTNALSASTSLPAGKHTFAFFAFNTAGTKWSSTVNATVK